MHAERDPRIVWDSCADPQAWVVRSVAVIVEALRSRAHDVDDTRLLLSGGSSPVPVYCALASADLDWTRIAIGLVDDRDVEPDDVGSNARLLRESLFAHSLPIRLRVLRDTGQTIDAAVDRANSDASINPVGAVVVLGMGEDGHTASLFPRAADLERALQSREAYMAFDASGCVGAGIHTRRITLTAHGIRAAATRILLMRGETKRAVFERALEAGD
ncbi:MAG: 6-phosphogluconolactonase, partial [Dokdonella sp.]